MLLIYKFGFLSFFIKLLTEKIIVQRSQILQNNIFAKEKIK